MKRQSQGFTLIELVVAVAIIGILSTMAYRSYQKSIIRGNRSAAQGQLLQMAQAMERYYSTHDTYPGTASSVGFTQSPASGTAVYTLSITTATNTTNYTLQATPASTGLNKNDGGLRLTSQGVQTWDKSNNGSYSAAWTDR